MGDAAQVVARRSDIAWIDSENRVVVVCLHDLARPPVLLSDSAAEIWRALGDSTDPVAVVAAVARVFGVDPSSIAADVHGWLVEAQSLGLVTLT